jgi:elongation factor G
VESILHHAGKLPAPGTVEKGNTVCDFDPQEKTHQHSLDSALVNFDYDGARINLIDTPASRISSAKPSLCCRRWKRSPW